MDLSISIKTYNRLIFGLYKHIKILDEVSKNEFQLDKDINSLYTGNLNDRDDSISLYNLCNEVSKDNTVSEVMSSLNNTLPFKEIIIFIFKSSYIISLNDILSNVDKNCSIIINSNITHKELFSLLKKHEYSVEEDITKRYSINREVITFIKYTKMNKELDLKNDFKINKKITFKYLPFDNLSLDNQFNSSFNNDEINFSFFEKLIEDSSFIESYKTSVLNLLKYKKVFYIKNKEHINMLNDARDNGKMGINYDNFIIDNIITTIDKKVNIIDNSYIFNNLKYILYGKNGLNSIIGRDNVKNDILSLLYSFSKNYKLLTGKMFLNIAFMANSGSGKCLGKDTPVRMYDGSVKMVQDIKVGDYLIGDDSKRRKVLNITKGYEHLYRIHQSKGESYVVNESHILTLVHKDDIFLKNPIDVKLTDVLNNYSELVYKLRGYRCAIEYNSDNQCNLVKNNFYKAGYYLNDDININSYKFVIIEQRILFLRGIIDRYGEYDNIYPYIIIITLKDVKLYPDIIEIAHSLGLWSYVNYNTIIIEDSLNILKSENNFKISLNSTNLSILSIEYLSHGAYYGFTLDSNTNERFLLKDYTVTHNTHISTVLSTVFSKSEILVHDSITTLTKADLIGGFIGHTPIITKTKLYRSLESVMFIDECHQLISSDHSNSDFGHETMSEIVNFADKFIGKSAIIVAGYKDKMRDNFFKMNEGLYRRFPYKHTLENYTLEELSYILINNIQEVIEEELSDEMNNTLFSILKILTLENKLENQAGDLLTLSNNIILSIYSFDKDWRQYYKELFFNSVHKFLQNKL